MDKLLEKLKDWIKVIQAALLGVIIIEGILVIIISVASNNLGDTLNYWYGILLFCGLVYIFLLVIRAAYQYKFPSSIVDELISKRQLEEKNKLFDRQKAINEYITTAIQGLNKQTCVINDDTNNLHLCDQELEVRLTDLLQPIVSYTDVILDTSTEKKFSIGIHLDSYQKFPKNYDEIEIVENEFGPSIKNLDSILDQGILILRDELNLSELLIKNLIDTERIGGASYEIQTAIKRTLTNLAFNSHDFIYKKTEYTIICSEILEVCSDDYVNGVLFIIFRKGIKYPADVPEILKIFNRVTANYVSKYNDCIYNKIIKTKSEIKDVNQ
jgi:hypothetical protein